MTKLQIVGIVVLVVIIAIIIISRINKKRKAKKEMAMHAEDKLREQALDRVILNPDAPKTVQTQNQATPFSVTYDANNVQHDKMSNFAMAGSNKIMVQLTENSELSAKKYMLDPAYGINIGSREGENHIVLNDIYVDPVQCNIAEYEGKIYMRNAGNSGKLVLVRGSERAYVERNAVELRTGDFIVISQTMFRVDLIKLK